MSTPVIYQDIRCRCPRCNAPNPHVRAKGPFGIRWHRCDCGKVFKSVPASSLETKDATEPQQAA